MKVGDYVHWRYSNYLSNGLTVDKGGGAAPIDIFNKQRTMLLNSLKDTKHDEATREQLERQINFFFDPTPAVLHTGFTPQQMANIKQFLDNLVNKTIKKLRPKALDKAGWERDTLNTYGTGGGSITLDDGSAESWAEIRKSRSFRNNSTPTTYYAVDRRIKQLCVQRDKLNAMASKSVSDINFITGVNQLMQDYKSFADEVSTMVKQETSGNVKGHFYVSGTQTAGIRSTKFSIDNTFANRLQDLIDMTVSVTNVELKGILGEVVPVVSQWAWSNFQNKSYAEIQQLMAELDTSMTIDLFTQKAGIGQQTSKKISMASKVISTGGISGNTQVPLGKSKLNTSYTQDKVDIALDLDSGETINASVKNVNLASGHNIRLLSGANVVNFVQDYPTFANHYLNVTGNIRRSSDRAPNSTVKAAHEALKLTIALHAFAGGLWAEDKQGNVGRTAMAELFIVNDSSSHGHYKVYYIADLLEKVSKNLNYIKLDIPQTHNNAWLGPHYNSLTHAWARVARMLGELREQKLKVSLDPAILKT